MLLEAIANAQRRFIIESDCAAPFQELLAAALKITGGKIGLIADVLREGDGSLTLKARATSADAGHTALHGMLTDALIASGVSIHNDIGQPELANGLAFSVSHGGEVLGFIAVGNAANGFTAAHAKELQPLVLACSGLLVGARETERRKAAERATKEGAERFRAVFRSNLLGIAFWTSERVLFDANDSFLQMLGWDAADVEARRLSWPMLVPPDCGDVAIHQLAKVSETGVASTFETALYHSNGRRVPVLMGAARLDASGAANMAFIADITERKSLEEQLRQSQKMEAIGRLAGGIAHDFNNLLVVMLGYADLLIEGLAGNPDLGAKAEQIRLASSRASELTRQLLAYSRRQVMQPRIISLSRTVDAMHRLLRRLIGEDINLQHMLNAAGSVKADPGQIEQVIMNLAVNARDAMREGGTLTIETMDVELDDTYMRRHGDIGNPGPYVMLAVSDTGVGMSHELTERIFEPFFSTKEKGEGTGLGLSTVYGIVKQSGGNIFVYTEQGKGTTFKIYLPRVKADNAVELEETARDVPAVAGETILVVEDEDGVRQIVAEVLKTAGYTVLTASHGEDAFRKSAAYADTIHLLVTDVIMPRHNGAQVARRLQQERSGLKVLFISGYTANAIVHQGVLDPGVNYLQKPFRPSEIVRKVREILGG
jgi:two-component system, cell cycle sensor histidine kinase and response regulator CckA